MQVIVMHKNYENDDLMMYFKKRNCHCCGNILSKQNIQRLLKNQIQNIKNIVIQENIIDHMEILKLQELNIIV